MARRAPRPSTLPVFDVVKAQYSLLDHLGIEKLYASVGSPMGAMQSLAAECMHLRRVGKIVSISGTARSSPPNIAVRFAQRSGTCVVVFRDSIDPRTTCWNEAERNQKKNRFDRMAEPNWNDGFYYDGSPPQTGLKLARREHPAATSSPFPMLPTSVFLIPSRLI